MLGIASHIAKYFDLKASTEEENEMRLYCRSAQIAKVVVTRASRSLLFTISHVQIMARQRLMLFRNRSHVMIHSLVGK